MDQELNTLLDESFALIEKINTFPINCKAIERIKKWANQVNDGLFEINDVYEFKQQEEISLSEAWDEVGDTDFINDFIYELETPEITIGHFNENGLDPEAEDYVEESAIYLENLIEKLRFKASEAVEVALSRYEIDRNMER